MQPLPYCVYVLQSLKDAKLYIGHTEDLEQRLSDHHQGRTLTRTPLWDSARLAFWFLMLLSCEWLLRWWLERRGVG